MLWRITHFPVLPSTNDVALDWMRSGRAEAGDVLVADEQTSGRGRMGRTWHSARGALLLTAVLPFTPDRVGWTALAAGTAVALAVRDLGAPAVVKWPNDVLLHDRKLAGVLTETAGRGLVAVGIGMNVRNPLPPDPAVAAGAIRLADFLPDVTVAAALDAVLIRLEEHWDLLAAPDLSRLRSIWARLDTTAGRQVRCAEQELVGTAEGVDAEGRLLIRTNAARCVAAFAGEVRFV